MNLFEKIYNYQMFARLMETQTYLTTAPELAWLKTMLNHPEAEHFFTKKTLEKLHHQLEEYEALPLTEMLIEKAKSKEVTLYHPLLAHVRQMILNKNQMQIATSTRINRSFEAQYGIPYKLNYSMTKKQWYVIWLHKQGRYIIHTPLHLITSCEESELANEEYDHYMHILRRKMDQRKETATLQIPPSYNEELSRILYAFSCFEKEVQYDAEQDTYSITLTYLKDESEFVRSKLRFLGKRVKVIDNHRLMQRMKESARKALELYQDNEE